MNPGILICEGGQPTGFLAPLCSPGTKRILVRNAIMEGTYQEVTGTAATLVGGKATVVAQCNLDDNYFGFCWGTWEWAAPGQAGKWEGSWSGTIDYIAGTGAGDVHRQSAAPVTRVCVDEAGLRRWGPSGYKA